MQHVGAPRLQRSDERRWQPEGPPRARYRLRLDTVCRDRGRPVPREKRDVEPQSRLCRGHVIDRSVDAVQGVGIRPAANEMDDSHGLWRPGC